MSDADFLDDSRLTAPLDGSGDSAPKRLQRRTDQQWGELLWKFARDELDQERDIQSVKNHLYDIQRDRVPLKRGQLLFFAIHPEYAEKHLPSGSKNRASLEAYVPVEEISEVPVEKPGWSRTDADWADLLKLRSLGELHESKLIKSVTTHLSDIKAGKIRIGEKQVEFFKNHPDYVEKYIREGTRNGQLVAGLEDPPSARASSARRGPQKRRAAEGPSIPKKWRAESEWAALVEAHATDAPMSARDLKATDTYLSDLKRGKVKLKGQVVAVFLAHPAYAGRYLPPDPQQREPYEAAKRALDAAPDEGTVEVHEAARATVPVRVSGPVSVAGVPPLRLPGLRGPELLRAGTESRPPGRR